MARVVTEVAEPADRQAWQRRKVPKARVTLEELRQILGVNEARDEKTGAVLQSSRLTLWPNLKQRALGRAVREITRKSDLAIRVITYEREKYRKVTAVLFEILVKPQS